MICPTSFKSKLLIYKIRNKMSFRKVKILSKVKSVRRHKFISLISDAFQETPFELNASEN